MTRCPNCGSAIRIGAKFCTSCGFRLVVDEPASTPVNASTRSPFATTSSPAWSADPVARDSSAELAGVGTPQDDDDEPAWSKPVNMDDPAFEFDFSEDAPVSATQDRDGEETAEVAAADGLSDESNQPGASWMSPPPVDTSGPVSDDMLASLTGDGRDHTHVDDTTEVDPTVDEGEGSPTAEVADADLPAPSVTTTYAWDKDDHQIHAVRDEPGSAATNTNAGTSSAESGSGDGLAEARELAAKLTEVLAGIRSGGSPAPGGATAVSSVADEADVEALWAVVRSAQERPRDVDVMLDLVLRAETIAAVLTDRQVMLAALRGDEATVEETWAADDDQPSTYPAWGA